ncbi:ABC transporter permease [Pseudomonas sp. CA3A]|uniref:ABC transporter permease n=2 Tax=Pseudomonas typographi TaxID=2715964 RepID=A0ABR7Z3G9_9PSED|nr:ABC transporter permease [Pseudomonas typographi]
MGQPRPSLALMPAAKHRQQQPLPSLRALAWRRRAAKLDYWLWPWLLPLIILGLWWLGGRQQWLGSQVLPSPGEVLDSLTELLASGELQRDVLISLERVLEGFLLGSALGLALGAAMGLSERASDYLYPLVRLIAYVPLLGWLPLLMLAFGIGETLKAVLVAQAALLPVALNTYNGIRAVPPHYVEVGRIYGFSRRQALWRIILPAAFPMVWSSIRYGLTKSWLALVVVELLASSEGLGFLMVDSRQLYRLDAMLVAVVSIGVVGFVLDQVLAMIEKRILRWRRAGFAS